MRLSVCKMQTQASNTEETEIVNVAEIVESIQLPVAKTPMDGEFEQLYHQDSVNVLPQASETSDLIQSKALVTMFPISFFDLHISLWKISSVMCRSNDFHQHLIQFVSC